jgi:hypothetical protein
LTIYKLQVSKVSNMPVIFPQKQANAKKLVSSSGYVGITELLYNSSFGYYYCIIIK